MEIKHTSFFKDQELDFQWLKAWVAKLQATNERKYEEIQIQTSLGNTHIWGINAKEDQGETLVIFPGARTTSLFWDFDRGLDNLGPDLNIFLVETNGLPNFSEGNTPDIRSDDYGVWASEVLDKLKIKKTFIAGASFGGLICMKLGITHPGKVKGIFLLNPGCFQPFSLKPKNLYYNLLPLIAPGEKNVAKFLDKAVFFKPHHRLSPHAEKMIIDYELFAITRYKDNTQKPYYMKEDLCKMDADVYLIEGAKDILFPYEKSIKNAKDNLTNLKDVVVFNEAAHGIETYAEALRYIGTTIMKIKDKKAPILS